MIVIGVDDQFGFVDPQGGLYVKGAEKVINPTCKFLVDNKDQITKVIWTGDNHPYEDESYKEPNIEWPIHCNQNSVDAGIINDLINCCVNNKIPFEFFIKGNTTKQDNIERGLDNRHTEYGAFENIWENYQGDPYKVMLVNRRGDSKVVIDLHEEIVVCGIAGDYCVLNTIKNLLKIEGPKKDKNFKGIKLSVFFKGIASIDDGSTLDNFVVENNIGIIE